MGAPPPMLIPIILFFPFNSVTLLDMLSHELRDITGGEDKIDL